MKKKKEINSPLSGLIPILFLISQSAPKIRSKDAASTTATFFNSKTPQKPIVIGSYGKNVLFLTFSSHNIYRMIMNYSNDHHLFALKVVMT